MLELIKKLNCEEYQINFDDKFIKGSILEIKDNFILFQSKESLSLINISKIRTIVPFNEKKTGPVTKPKGA